MDNNNSSQGKRQITQMANVFYIRAKFLFNSREEYCKLLFIIFIIIRFKHKPRLNVLMCVIRK